MTPFATMPEEVNEDFLVKNNFSVRPAAAKGLWVFFLLPLSLITSSISQPIILSSQYKLVTAASCILVCTSLYIITKWYKNERLKILNWGPIIIALVGGAILNVCLHKGWSFSLLSAFFSTFIYLKTYTFLLSSLKESFTLGEAAVVSQGITLFLYSTGLNILSFESSNRKSNMQIATTIVQIGLIGITTLTYIVNKFDIRRPKTFYVTMSIVLPTTIIIPLHIILNRSPVLWIFGQILGDVLLLKLFLYWSCCVAVAVLAVANQIYYAKKASTRTRKIFHLLAILVYMPGLHFRCSFLYMASGIMLGIFFVLEILRLIRVPPLGSRLEDSYVIFRDTKDTGLLALTPIYLLVGVSLPIWIHPAPCDVTDSTQFSVLPLLAGLLSIGVGDTAASYVGSTFGRYNWKGSVKTIEGTLACIFSQLGFVYLLYYIGFLPFLTHGHVTKLIISVFIGSMVEAKTSQIDNLVLPLVMYIILI